MSETVCDPLTLLEKPMKKVIRSERIPIKMWLDHMDEEALQQAKNLANLPFAFHHIAIMPDAHVGYGMPIGGVLPALEAVVPNAVGVDIGCGMSVLKTGLTELDVDTLKKIMGDIRRTVPVGFNQHPEPRNKKWLPELHFTSPLLESQLEKALYQVGTLGGGNHFIEIQKGSDGWIWIMIHSGSRNLGHTIATHHHNVARELNRKRGADQVPEDLSFFLEGTEEFDAYWHEMQYCVQFALNNRLLMMERVKEAFLNHLETSFSDFINKPHNFADREIHFGTEVILHRKGATRARKGELGMIPGSQGSSSYIVEGLGNPESFHSCSHGAGRVMSRARARRELSLKEEIRRLDEMGVVHAIRHRKDLDEAPGSYKDISEVMENQKDLAKILVELTPLGVIKA